MSDHVDVEPPIIDYARFYGLVQNHLEPPPLQGLTLPENLGSFLEDPPELFHIDLSNVKVPEERLAIDAGAASLLSFIPERTKHEIEDVGIDRHRLRRLKIELPLLRSDHEIDLLRFVSPIAPDLENEFLPLETLDVEEDEGVELPSYCYALPDQFAKKSRSEKIEASKDDLLYLQQVLKYHLEGGEHAAFEIDGPSYKRVSSIHLLNQGNWKLTLDRELFQNQCHLHCYHFHPALNLMYPHPIVAVLISCPTLSVLPERKHAKLSN